MPRSGRLQSFIREYRESPKLEKASFIPPFMILVIEIILIYHAIIINETYVFVLTFILVVISTIEIILVSLEIHAHYQRGSFDRLLTIRLDDYILERKEKNVKRIVNDFIEEHPEYYSHRGEIYHTACQILETHAEEVWEKKLTQQLEKFIKRRKKQSVDEILEAFVKKYPPYKRYRSKIYEKICNILGRSG